MQVGANHRQQQLEQTTRPSTFINNPLSVSRHADPAKSKISEASGMTPDRMLHQFKQLHPVELTSASLKSPKHLKIKVEDKGQGLSSHTSPHTLEQSGGPLAGVNRSEGDSGIHTKKDERFANQDRSDSIFNNKVVFQREQQKPIFSQEIQRQLQLQQLAKAKGKALPLQSDFTQLKFSPNPKQVLFQQNQRQGLHRDFKQSEYADQVGLHLQMLPNGLPNQTASSPINQSPVTSKQLQSKAKVNEFRSPPPRQAHYDDYGDGLSRNNLIKKPSTISRDEKGELSFQPSKIKILSQLKNYPDAPTVPTQLGLRNETISKHSVNNDVLTEKSRSVIGSLKNINTKSKSSLERLKLSPQSKGVKKGISPIRVKAAVNEFSNHMEYLQNSKLVKNPHSAQPTQQDTSAGDGDTSRKTLQVKPNPRERKRSRSSSHGRVNAHEVQLLSTHQQHTTAEFKDPHEKDPHLSKSVEFGTKAQQEFQIKKTINISPQKFSQQQPGKRKTANFTTQQKIQLLDMEKHCVLSDSKNYREDSFVVSIESSHNHSQKHLLQTKFKPKVVDSSYIRSPSPHRQSYKNLNQAPPAKRQPQSLQKPSNPLYFQTFQQGEVGKIKGQAPVHMPQIRMHKDAAGISQDQAEMEQFYVFNNFAYQNQPMAHQGLKIDLQKKQQREQQPPREGDDSAYTQTKTNFTSKQFPPNRQKLKKHLTSQKADISPPHFQEALEINNSSPTSQKRIQFPVIEGGAIGSMSSTTENQFQSPEPGAHLQSKRNSQSYYGNFDKTKMDLNKSPYLRRQQQQTQYQIPLGDGAAQYLDRLQQIQNKSSSASQQNSQNLSSFGHQLYQQFLNRKGVDPGAEKQRALISQVDLGEQHRHSDGAVNLNYQYDSQGQDKLVYLQRFKLSNETTQNIIKRNLQSMQKKDPLKQTRPFAATQENLSFMDLLNLQSQLQTQALMLKKQQQEQTAEIMIQGLSKERAVKAAKQALFQQQAHQLMQQKLLQEQFQRILLSNFNQFALQNKLQNLTLRDLEDCLKLAEIQKEQMVKKESPHHQEDSKAAKEEKKNSPSKKKQPKSFWNTPQDIPKTKIKIYHEFDNTLHFNHKLNVTIRNINAVIRLIFKNTKDQSAITAISPGTSMHQAQSFIDENRLREIQKIANTMKVGIPRRFDSKSAIREFIQSRSFISAIKQSMNMQLYTQINQHNNTLDLINAKQDKIAKFFDKKDIIRQREQQQNRPKGVFANNDMQSNQTSQHVSPHKKRTSNSKANRPSLMNQMGTPGFVASQTPKKGKSKDRQKPQFLTDQKDPHSESMFSDGGQMESIDNSVHHDRKPSKRREKKERENRIRLAKQREEELQFERELNEEFERELQRKEDEDLEPFLTKEEKLRIEQNLIERKEKLKEKEKLLEYTRKYYVGPGNNCQVVKNALKQRYWWTPAHSEDFCDANFIWTSWKRDKHIDFLKEKGVNETDQPIKIYARMDNNKQLTNKKGIFINMREYYEAMGLDPFQVLPLTFHIRNQQDSEFKRLEIEYHKLTALIKDRAQKMNIEISKLLAARRNKRGGKKMARIVDSDEDDEYDLYSECEDEEIMAIKKKFRVPVNSWIVKPGENSNRGVGINVVQSLQEIRSLIGSRRAGQENTYIVQKYIDYPLLIHRRKFDFRVFAMLTSINKKLKGYFYEDGYIRTSSREFDLNDLSDKFVHLTNDAIQKQADDFGKFENNNKMSYGDFQRYLNQYHADLEIDVLKHLVPQMKRLITDTFRATCFKIDPKRLLNSFEVLGYDFMLDENFKLNLIEVNTNPCLETESPLLARIIPELLDNSFKLTLDPLFPSPDLTTNRKLQVNELPQEIKYTLIFDEDIDGPEIKELFEAYYQKRKGSAEAERNRQEANRSGLQNYEEIESDEEGELDDEDY